VKLTDAICCTGSLDLGPIVLCAGADRYFAAALVPWGPGGGERFFAFYAAATVRFAYDDGQSYCCYCLRNQFRCVPLLRSASLRGLLCIAG
jgi:hypothetical protein